MRPHRFGPLLVTLFGLGLCAGCSTLLPSTMTPAPSGPYVASAREAAVVVYRPSVHANADGDALPIDERWSYVRVFADEGAPVADLRATQHTVVRLTPGVHRLFVKNWSAETKPPCVGALDAHLGAGRVYAARIETGTRDGSAQCLTLRLVPVRFASLDAFFRELRGAKSEQRTFLGEGRQRSALLDVRRVELEIVKEGTDQLREAPVSLAEEDGASWTAPR